MSYVHLHNRTQYSLLDGAMSPKALISRAKELEMPAVAITDTCNLYCAVELYKGTKGSGTKGILGSEIWLWPKGLDTIKPETQDGGWNLVFLVENEKGYQNLCFLITQAIFHGMHYRPRIDYSLLEAHKDGLIVLTGGLNGVVGRSILEDRPHEARMHLERLGNILGPEHLYLELQDYGLAKQVETNNLSRTLAEEFGLKTVVTNDCRYIEPIDAVTLDLLNCIARGENLDSPNRNPIQTDQQYFKTKEEMLDIFPDDLDAIERTAEIAERCNYKFKLDTYWFPATDPPTPNPELPEGIKMDNKEYRADTQANWEYFYRAYPPPINFDMPDPKTEQIPQRVEGAGNLCGYFEWYCHKGLEVRLRRIPVEQHEEYYERLDVEIGIIERMGFPAYMLIVAEFINWSKDNEIPVGPGRGSAAGSLVAYSMGITDIDPLRFGLLFERFLNPERVSMPDIDVDFCQDRREEAIQHVREKYGAELVSQIITYGKLQTKAAVKDVARTLGMSFLASNNLAKLIPEEKGLNIPLVREDPIVSSLSNVNPLVNRVFSLAQRVEGMTRQTGVHAAGVVIADRPLVEHAPLYRDGPEGGPVVQYDMKSAEGIGLIKFDFLGLKTLDQIRDAVKMIERNTGTSIDMSAIDTADEAVYKLLSEGDSIGVFQVESQGMQQLLQKMRPNTIDDLIALIALYRPGPLSSGMVDTFIRCKHGRQEVVYPHPLLEDILKSTYGSIVYQEQVMQIAQILASFSLGEADLLRRAMGKKKVEAMAEMKVRFNAGAVANGVDGKKADEIFDLMAYFAGYGFNKSHSAAYGMIAYQTAWLKTHHRAEYMAALMTIEANNTTKILEYIQDCRTFGVDILEPNVNKSLSFFDVPKENRNQIRYGLSAVKGAGTKAVQSIIDCRESLGGQFDDFMHCLEHLDYRVVNKKVLENLIKCGAFDWTGQARKSLFATLNESIQEAQRIQDEKNSGQVSLFNMFADTFEAPVYQIPDLGEWPIGPKLQYEAAALGFCVTGHHLDAYVDVEENTSHVSTGRLKEVPKDTIVTVLGNLVSVKYMKSKRNNKDMAIVVLNGRDGNVDCMFFGEAYQNGRRLLDAKTPVSISGKLDHRTDPEDPNSGVMTSIIADQIVELGEIRERQSKGVIISLFASELVNPKLKALHQSLEEAPKGDCPILIDVHYPKKGFAHLKSNYKVKPNEEFLNGLENTFGRSDIWRLI
ncbi:MAG: DNA polymerase III subunit alpha [Myxococcota bacterium]|nr:DNA polymerase III subunit alpha [Myxococcota bacterium]